MFKEWGELFPDLVIANATIDRMFENAEILLFTGKSYRLAKRIEMPELDIPKIKG